LLAHDRNRRTTAERFPYLRCHSCATVFLANVPTNLARYYESDSYYQFEADGEPAWKSDHKRLRVESYRVGLVRGEVSPGRLIEIGSGTGGFAVTADSAGFEVTAVEMNQRCCDYLNERTAVHAICSDRPLEVLAALEPARVVALWHVLEHLADPAEMLELAAAKLEPGGVLAIGVPNIDSLQFRLLGRRWPHLDAPRHLCLIPPAALVKRGAELGLGCVAMTTNDPDGIESNLFGWAYALRRDPSLGMTPPLAYCAAVAVRWVMSPFERTGNRGSTITLLLRKGS
jgi:SAM-dependent methyltransferase